mmetsp:Transcript_9313/g.18162  ORF Transcript_9313/g.18162 Transcript_9313/m.18162 type:complete len:319 (-) Transcript_9313:115-1071(-)
MPDAGLAIGSALLLAFGGLMRYQGVRTYHGVEMVREMETLPIPTIYDALLKAKGPRPSMYVALEGVTACRYPVGSGLYTAADKRVAARCEETFVVERVEKTTIEGSSTSVIEETLVDRAIHKHGPLEISDSAIYANSRTVRDVLRNLVRARRYYRLCPVEGEVDVCKVVVDDECYDLQSMLVCTHSGRFKPAAGSTIIINNEREFGNRTQRTLVGHRTIHRTLPLGKTIYALGKITLDKDTGQLTLRRSRGWRKPFVFRYGTPDDALREIQAQKSCLDISSFLCFGVGALTGILGLLGYDTATRNHGDLLDPNAVNLE